MAVVEQLITDNLDIWSSAVKAKSAAGRGTSKKLELYGIKKLRGLILELAVHGLLVPQDPTDEPAPELLKKIAAEKSKLVKEGQIKKQKLLPPIVEDDKLFKLPEGWVWTQLGQITEIAPRNNLDDDLEVSFVPMPMVSTSYKGDHEQEVRTWAEIKKGYTHFADGDIALAKITPCFENSKAAVFKKLKNGYGAGTTELHIARPISDTVDPLFILLYLKAPMFLETGKTKMTGSAGQKRVPNVFFSCNPLPLPPFKEQHRIVAKVDELMALCDRLEQQTETSISAHKTLVKTLLSALTKANEQDSLNEAWARIAEHFDTLFTTEWSIDQLKQTILQLAVMGKLVPQNPNDEPANTLLKGKEVLKDEDIPFRIPDSWVWARVDEFAKTRLGKMLDKAKNKGTPFRYLRNINVRWFNFDLSDVKEMRFEVSELEEFSLNRGDVLICEGGYPGRSAVWDERESKIYFQKALHRVRFYNGINPNYFVNVLRESSDSGRLNSYFTGAGIQHFTGKGLKSFLVPLPPLNEQNCIITKLDEFMALCDTLKEGISTAHTIQLQLADAIAEQALG